MMEDDRGGMGGDFQGWRRTVGDSRTAGDHGGGRPETALVMSHDAMQIRSVVCDFNLGGYRRSKRLDYSSLQSTRSSPSLA